VAHAPCGFRLQDDEEGDALTSGIDGNDSFAVLSNITTLRQLTALLLVLGESIFEIFIVESITESKSCVLENVLV